MLTILKRCQKELAEFPEEVRGDLADAIARLELGHSLGMPLSRPMQSIGKGVHELRFLDRAGIYRVVYWLAGAGSIYLLYAFMKKAQQTSDHDIEVAKKRLKEVM